MGFTIGMPAIKLSSTEGKGGRHSGNLSKVAEEALSERLGKDLDINPELTHTNQYLPCNINGEIKTITSAKELIQYSDDWVEKRNKEVKENNDIIRPLIRELNRQRKIAGEKKLGDKDALAIINKEREKNGEPPLKLMAKIKSDAVLMCNAIIKPPMAFMETLTREQQERFLLDSFDKFKELVGEDNVKAAVIHWDELNPHIHIFWQPVTDDGRLCAKELFDIKFLDKLNREMPQYLREKGWEIDDCDAYDIEEAQKIREEQGEKAYREYNEKRRQERADKKSGRGSKKFKDDMDKAAAEAEARREAAEQAERLAIQQREAEEQAAEQAKKQREADEQKSAELQSEVTELTAKKDSLEGKIETSEAKLSDIQKRIAQAEEELVRKQEIPPPPKKPFERKPTPPITISREEYISNSVNRDLGFLERKKQAKEVGADYDEKMSAYYRDLALQEQYERDSAAYKEEYEMTLTVQKVAAQQARTAQEQAQTAASQKATAAELTERENCLAKAEKQVQAERASVDVIVEKRVQQALQKAQTFVEYGRTNARFNALFSKFIGNGESYDDKKLHHEQKQTAHDEQKQPSETPLPKKRPKQKGYDDI